jgi:hypothetical protein
VGALVKFWAAITVDAALDPAARTTEDTRSEDHLAGASRAALSEQPDREGT